MLSSWTALLLTAIAAGIAACAWFVARRRLAIASATASAVLMIVSLTQVVAIARWTDRAGVGLIAAVIAVAAGLGGFLLAAALVPAATRLPSRAHRDDGRESPQPGVIVLAHGQPEHYSPSTTTQAFERLSESGVALPPLALRVFAYLSDRGRYRRAGINPTRLVVRAVTSRAAGLLKSHGFTGEVREAWLDGVPRLCDAIATMKESGSAGIAVVLLDVAQSYEYDLALRQLASPDCDVTGVSITYSPPLWSQDALAALVRDKVLGALPGGPTGTDGVAIVSEGQPAVWDRTHPQTAEQRTFFCQRVRTLLIESGLESANVRTAWLDWHDPDVTEVVRHLSAVGCRRIVVVPATSVADTLDIAVDLPAAVAQAAVDPDIKVEVLHGWGDDPVIAEVLANAARAALGELGWPPDSPDQ